MGHNQKPQTNFTIARLCIRTILYQDLIAFHVRVYMFFATGIILMLALAGKIPLTTALVAIGIGGVCIVAILCLLIRTRKEFLLAIHDPELRDVAHDAMLIYLSRKKLSARQRQPLTIGDR